MRQEGDPINTDLGLAAGIVRDYATDSRLYLPEGGESLLGRRTK